MKKNIILFLFLTIMVMLMQSIHNPWFVWNELLYHLEVADLRGIAKATIYAMSYLMAVLLLFFILRLKSARLFRFFMILLFLLLSIDFFVQLLGVSHGFSYDEYSLAINEVGNYKYLIAYATNIIMAMAMAIMVVVVLYFLRQRFATKDLEVKFSPLLLLPFILIYFACFKMDTFKLSSYPAMVKIPNIAVSYWQFSQPIKERILKSNIKTIKPSKFKNIVWIIDESVTGSYLSVNGYEKPTTPFLEQLSKNSHDFVNFGRVNSISNCSSSSNLFLRIGLNPYKHTKEQINSLPTIFQYAQRAGYKTWLFDSQTRENHLQNHLSIYDKKSIEHFETLGTEVERVDRDETFLNRMIDLVNDKSSTDSNFIVLVKYGAHFPYLLTYDEESKEFSPVLESSYAPMDEAHKERQINTYLNSLYFNVDLYLKQMVEKIDLAQSIVFYTSDHGQNILETKGLSRTHCNSEQIVKNEVTVPLFLFTKDAQEVFAKEQNAFYSQIQIFPTTLSLLGYDNSVVEQYGKTLKHSFLKSSDRKYILSTTAEAKAYK